MTSAKTMFDPYAGLMSYLIPGLGQVLQGRIGKGLLFFLCLYSLFFYGMWLGKMKNIWLPDARMNADGQPKHLPPGELPGLGKCSGITLALYHRPQFLAQFWMGAAVWPAIVQYQLTEWPANQQANGTDGQTKPTPVLGHYMQAPTELELNALQRSEDKTWDLGWVYTVIAGVLNLLVILDAMFGPVVRDDDPHWQPKPGEEPNPGQPEPNATTAPKPEAGS